MVTAGRSLRPLSVADALPFSRRPGGLASSLCLPIHSGHPSSANRLAPRARQQDAAGRPRWTLVPGQLRPVRCTPSVPFCPVWSCPVCSILPCPVPRLSHSALSGPVLSVPFCSVWSCPTLSGPVLSRLLLSVRFCPFCPTPPCPVLYDLIISFFVMTGLIQSHLFCL